MTNARTLRMAITDRHRALATPCRTEAAARRPEARCSSLVTVLDHLIAHGFQRVRAFAGERSEALRASTALLLPRANASAWLDKRHVPVLAAGWGIFDVVEGLIDHQIHHVRDRFGGPIGWDLGFPCSHVDGTPGELAQPGVLVVRPLPGPRVSGPDDAVDLLCDVPGRNVDWQLSSLSARSWPRQGGAHQR